MTFSHCFPLPAGFSGRCQSHVYPFPRQKVRSSPGSCPSPPPAVTAAWRATLARRTIGRCPNHWRSPILRDSSRRSLTGSTQSRAFLPWAPRVRHQALSARRLSTPWPSSRSRVTSALILVSGGSQNNTGASIPRHSKSVLGLRKQQVRNVCVDSGLQRTDVSSHTHTRCQSSETGP